MSDAKSVQKLAGEKEIYETTLNIPHPYEDGMAESWIGTHIEHFKEKKSLTLAIINKKDKQLIGAIGLSFMRYNKAEIGYWIGKDFWDQGFCTEAGKALVDYAFTALGMNKIIGRHLFINPSSGRVMQKIGMRKEGTFEDDVLKDSYYHDIVYWGITFATWTELRDDK
ncbi:MAG: GNAT family N-acetyltransferase [Clostridia bacterium]|nr:GNAT family N-acetyltransferase [Clostridia bacterium]